MPDATAILAGMKAVCEAATKGVTEWEAVKIPMPLNENGKAKWPNKDHFDIFMVRTVDIHPQLKDHEWLIQWWHSPYTEQESYPSFASMEDAEFHAAARTGWPATIQALRVLMEFAEHEDSLWGDPSNPAAQALEKAKAILEGHDD